MKPMSPQVSIAATASALALAALCLHAPTIGTRNEQGLLVEPVATTFAMPALTLPTLLRR
jgi:hypothetical protein